MVAGTVMASAQCRANVPGLISDCSKFVQKGGQQISPSAACCGVVKRVGVGCLCSLLSGGVAKKIDTNKAVFVARSCGLTLQPGSKCGGT
ncbi:hypothetical protein L6164_029999 [Bauhinia variegata]|uniref:Uncharacterized protein n=1 Tax=Bauhinia variegata TaxID=167791 RepID=A0ACB9LAF6_BAUVA|nr:hypothetical protein L6164_029999 [Bauhinia variegata]